MFHQVHTWRAMQKKDHVYNHVCNYVTVDYQQRVYGNTANQIHGFTIDCGKFILISNITYTEISSLPMSMVLTTRTF